MPSRLSSSSAQLGQVGEASVAEPGSTRNGLTHTGAFLQVLLRYLQASSCGAGRRPVEQKACWCQQQLALCGAWWPAIASLFEGPCVSKSTRNHLVELQECDVAEQVSQRRRSQLYHMLFVSRPGMRESLSTLQRVMRSWPCRCLGRMQLKLVFLICGKTSPVLHRCTGSEIRILLHLSHTMCCVMPSETIYVAGCQEHTKHKRLHQLLAKLAEAHDYMEPGGRPTHKLTTRCCSGVHLRLT